ncbi:hypothetical protein KJN74_05530, partial [Candidatus Bathyarchaeota archaeon]|nr:hypothetical protein [Candidatus Bathyarchaeota archaeon]
RVSGPDLNDGGWRGRLAKGTYDFILNASGEKFENAGLGKRKIKQIINHRDALLKSWDEKGPWGSIKGITPNDWETIVKCGVELQSVKIDTVVTPDINRLIRLSNSLHGKTGLKKMEFSIRDIEDFDPLKSAVVFNDGTVTIHVSEAPQFRVKDDVWGPFDDQKVELPTAAALMLLCKGLAKVVQ